ncbi:unnamed protein product [Cunninghamella echinulata]
MLERSKKKKRNRGCMNRVFRHTYYRLSFPSIYIKQSFITRHFYNTTATTTTTMSEIDISLYNTVTEGKATILFPKSNEVFYNPVQEFN